MKRPRLRPTDIGLYVSIHQDLHSTIEALHLSQEIKFLSAPNDVSLVETVAHASGGGNCCDQ